jgi:outer membrane lipoprotein-sorting protein
MVCHQKTSLFGTGWAVFALLAWAALRPFPARAGSVTNEAQARIALLQEGLRGTTSVQTDFVQRRNLAMLQQEITITGRIALDQAGRLAWRVETPMRCVFVLDGTTLRQWDEATDREQQVSLKGNPVFDVVSRQMRGWFLGDFSPLMKDFEVDAPADRPRCLVFRPIAGGFAAKAVRQVMLSCRPDRRYLDEIVIDECSGDRTRMVFSNTVLNAVLEADQWKVKPNVR